METRGPGGCGAYPYLLEMTGTFDECGSVCVSSAACIQFQKAPGSNGRCYLSSSSSGTHNPGPTQPAGTAVGTSWRCGFIVGWTLLQSSVKCASTASAVDFGSKQSLKSCAEACKDRPDCQYFIYGNNTTSCWMQQVTADNCGSDGFQAANYNFYKRLGNLI